MTLPPRPDPDPQDPYSRLDYRRLIAWPERLQREAAFLESVARGGPQPSVLDLGCGTGEHARFFAALGFQVVGLDLSAAQIRQACEAPLPPNLRFLVGDMTAPEQVIEEQFGTALTLGNALVHLLDQAALMAMCRGTHARLLPGGRWVVQILNYERLRSRQERALPVSVRPGDGEETVFLRLLRALPDGMMEFVPVTLRWRAEADPPVEVIASHVVRQRGWTRDELAAAFQAAGFATVEWFGDLRGSTFDPLASTDLVCVARRP